jgi:hypothetical protein
MKIGEGEHKLILQRIIKSSIEYNMEYLNKWEESSLPWWDKYEVIYILSHTETQAKIFTKDNEIPRSKFRIVHNDTQLRGVSRSLILMMDGWRFGKIHIEWMKIEQEVRYLEDVGRVDVMDEQDFQKKSKKWNSLSGQG